MPSLKGKVAVVAGATRGAGRGIACMLGEAGATVYCTGRSTRAMRSHGRKSDSPFDLEHRPETIEQTAELVDRYGGVGISVRVDHTVEEQVKVLFAQVTAEQGRLDILVNDVWGGDELTEWGKPFWKLSLSQGWLMQERAVRSHIITSRYAVPLMIERRQGLIVEITDGDNDRYRGNLFYDLAKLSVIRLAYAMAEELRSHNVTALAVTPGFLRSEAMLEHFGVTESNWQDGAKRDPHFIASETPFYIGRAIAALSADSNIMQKSGRVFSSWDLAQEYGFTDIDGRQPNWGKYFAENVAIE
ncbi:SDR family oxidoreductase [Fischerella sp. PCC 9605]|uniref:SDR family oxidoreductase n=1 Tax=Fischerella sp. PCC 9605 TaxID=1173024 RepID=UPI00047EED2C|nr:SDR family oxidoreductase [Fischerella sp. PCC 9605]